MPDSWTPGDLLDYEMFLEETLRSSSDTENLRTWYRDYHGKTKSGKLIYSWLAFMRNSRELILPGKTINRLYGITAGGLALIGLLAGSGLGWGILSYAGSNPVNLFLALSLLVFIPFLLTSFSFLLVIIPPGGNRSRRINDRLMRILRGSVDFSRRVGLVDRLHSDAVLSGISRFQGRSVIYRSLLRWSVSLPLQIRALSFHLGIFAAVLWRGLVQDIAFGWQTTLNVSSQDIYRLFHTISLPWQFFFSSPSAAQVEGSRVILKNGISGLDNGDLTVWWSYLWISILVYGILPRLFLLFYTFLRRQIVLMNLPFSDSKSRQLILKMKTPVVDTAGKEPIGKQSSSPDTGYSSVLVQDSMVFRVLIPSVRKDLISEEKWGKLISTRWGASLDSIIAVSLDDEEDAGIFDSLSGNNTRNTGFILVFEGWRPYTAAAGLYLDFIQSLQSEDSLVLVALAGRPGKGFDMEERDFDTWKQWQMLLPSAVSSGSCEIVRIKGWE